MYPEALMGSNTVDTMPEPTLLAFIDHGNVAETLTKEVNKAERLFIDLEKAGIDMEQITDGLLIDGVKLFADSYDDLLTDITKKRTELLKEAPPVESG